MNKTFNVWKSNFISAAYFWPIANFFLKPGVQLFMAYFSLPEIPNALSYKLYN